jgi:long-chain acyl-CoA synthetase
MLHHAQFLFVASAVSVLIVFRALLHLSSLGFSNIAFLRRFFYFPAMANSTLIELFEASVRKYPHNILLWEKQGSSYQGMTYAQAHEAVHTFAAGLISLGIAKGDRIALIAEGRNDWVISELGILYAGAFNVPLSVKLQEGNDLCFRLAHAGCRMAIVSATQAPKIRQIRKDLPALERVIVLDTMASLAEGEMSAGDLHARGREFLSLHRDIFEKRRTSVRGSDPATICYTSGTTADPKGVVLTHRNYTANVDQASGILDVPERYCSLLILPWDHCFAHTAGIYTLMRNGASMASVQVGKSPMETLKNIPVNIRETRPTFLLSVPTLAKNFKKNIEAGIKSKGAGAEAIFRAGLAVGYLYNGIGWNKGKGWRALLKPLVKLFDVILFSKIRENFGGRMEFFVGGGALLDIDLQRFFYAIGIPMLQGYGLSESAPVISANVLKRHKLGSSGSIVPDLQVRICNEQGEDLPLGHEGEIVVKGENVMAGYWNNEKTTRETVIDGWLHTGDLGYLDEDGFLYVLGRTKSLLIANDGEKYSPEGIEEHICSKSKYIDQMMLYNNQSPYTVALVVPTRDAVLGWMKAHGHSPGNEKGQCAALNLLEKEIDAYLASGHFAGMFPERWLPAAIAVLAEGFTEPNGQLNSTMKMVRGKITECYEERIKFLFTAEGKNVCNKQNKAVVEGWGGRTIQNSDI